MPQIDCICAPALASAALPRPSVWRRIGLAFALRRQRARLLFLDPHLLRDIGITAEQAQHEASRPIWEAREHTRDNA